MLPRILPQVIIEQVLESCEIKIESYSPNYFLNQEKLTIKGIGFVLKLKRTFSLNNQLQGQNIIFLCSNISHFIHVNESFNHYSS